jgi:hypothetical protein
MDEERMDGWIDRDALAPSGVREVGYYYLRLNYLHVPAGLNLP